MTDYACFRSQLLRVLSIALLTMLACATSAAAQTLMWNANTESDLAGYIVQYGTQSGNPSTTVDVGRVTSRTFTGLTAGTTYYFRVVAYNTAGQQSTPSSQISYAMPSTPPPAGPTITGISPTSGPVAGGTAITITGANFAAGATVRVGGAAATGVSVTSSSRIVATTPAGTAGAKSVQVTSGGVTATSPVSFTYTSTTAPTPTLTSVSPTSGPATGGTRITLTGTNFASGATVRVGGAAATSVTFVSATQVTATTPAGTAGASDVQITNPSGKSATRTGAFTYTATSSGLTITSVSPNTGPRTGGTRITIRGSGFKGGSGFYIQVGGFTASNPTFVSSTEVRATTPYSATTGARDVRVRISNGKSVTKTGAFLYTSGTTSAATQTLTANTLSAGTTQYLAEGVVTDQMSTELAIANPETEPTSVRLSFAAADGATAERTVDVAARSRATVDLREVPELAGQSFSTTIDSDVPVAVDRLVSWDGSGLAASLESAVAQASPTWYFAEGSTVDPYELYYLVQNPGATAVKIRVRYLLPGGAAALTRGYTVPAGGRTTIWVDREAPALASTDVAAEITSVTGAPIVVERSLFLKDAESSVPRGGDTSAGVVAPATSWNVEAATGSFNTRLLVANPGGTAARVQATYTTADGKEVVTSHVVAANSRASVNVAAESPVLANAMVDVKVDASSPVVVERTSSWGAGSTPDETISGGATTRGAARWLLAEAELGGDRQAVTSLAVTNRGAATNATVTLLFEDGPEASATFPVAAGARIAIPVAESFPMAANRRFSILVEGEDPSASLIVDRTMFWRAAGETRTAGADGAATRLP